MASSRSSAADPLGDAVARALAASLTRPGRVAVALSGGRDSVALLCAVAALPEARARDPIAIHVHHGLSARADAWQASCEALCQRLRVPLAARRVSVDPADPEGMEAAARRARYAALSAAAVEAKAAVVLLAHHQDDQAETLLLQLARGAGPHGLAGMAEARTDEGGLIWLRPLLRLPRSAIDAWVRSRGLAFVDDDSNALPRHRRNALRLAVVPAFARIFPGYPGTLARAAALQADAARLIDDLAAQDLAPLDQVKSEYYLKFRVVDKPGVLSRIAGVLGAHSISIASVLQKGQGQSAVPIFIVTHRAKESDMRAALAEADRLPDVLDRTRMIRIENNL